MKPIAVPPPEPYKNLFTSFSHLHDLHDAHVDKIISTAEEKDQWLKDADSIFMRSALTLICASWEAFIEDAARESVRFLVDHVKSPNDLPISLRKAIAKELKEDLHDLSPWKVAGDDWRTFIHARFEKLIMKRIRDFNTPKSASIKTLFSETLGIGDITTAWEWDGFPNLSVVQWIDKMVIMRGAIAHGRDPEPAPGSGIVALLALIIEESARKTCNAITEFLGPITGKVIWPKAQTITDWVNWCALANRVPLVENIMIYRDKSGQIHYAEAAKARADT